MRLSELITQIRAEIETTRVLVKTGSEVFGDLEFVEVLALLDRAETKVRGLLG